MSSCVRKNRDAEEKFGCRELSGGPHMNVAGRFCMISLVKRSALLDEYVSLSFFPIRVLAMATGTLPT